MKIDIYNLLAGLFFAFFFIWLILHIRDRRRVFNGLVFFLALASLLAGFIVIGISKDIYIITILPGLILLLLMFLVPILYVVGVFLLFSTGLKVVRKEGLSLSHLLSILLGLGILASSLLYPLLRNRIESQLVLALMGAFVTVFFYYVLGFVIFLTSSLLYKLWYERRNKDYLIVLGAGLAGDRVTPLLAGRIDRALDFYHSQKSRGQLPPKLIMSGGQGPDELIAEGQAMKNYALDQGIDPAHILVEDQSKSTRENLRFSTDLIREDFPLDKPRVLFVTTNYHVLRAGILAKNMGLDYNGLGSKTRLYFYVSALIREYIGLIYINLRKNIIFSSLLALAYILFFFFNSYFNLV